MNIFPGCEMTSVVPSNPESSCPVFSPLDLPRPPEVDPSEPLDPSNNLLLQMFLSELDAGLGEGEGPPTPTPTPSPQHSSTMNESTSLECTDFTGLDDPFLMQFTDIEGLLQDTNMISQSPGSSFSDSTPSSVTDHDFLQDLSLSVNVNPVSPFSSNGSDNVTFEFSDDVFCLNNSKDEPSLPPLSEAVIQHDHPYATPSSSKPSRKRNASSTDTPTTKKPKVVMKDEKYFERRHKNNLASQVSRAKRKNKCTSMFDKVTKLEEQNAELRTRVEEMTAEAEALKKLLVDRLAQ